MCGIPQHNIHVQSGPDDLLPSRCRTSCFALPDLCASSLRQGPANLFCIVLPLTDDPRSVSESEQPRGVLNVRIKCREVVHAHQTNVSAAHLELVCLHCSAGHQLLFALLRACTDSQAVIRHLCSAYAGESLRTEGLIEAAL